MNRRSAAFVLTAFPLAALLSACDPAVTVHLVRKDREPMSCEGGAEMTYNFRIRYRDGDQYEHVFEVDKEIGHPTAGMLPGSIERTVAWIQFEVYCGDSQDPVLVTPRINLPKGLEKKDDWNYYYYVDGSPLKPGGK